MYQQQGVLKGFRIHFLVYFYYNQYRTANAIEKICVMPYLWIFIGGGLGSMCRYGIARLLLPWQEGFPYATLLANALSCIVLGFLLSLDQKGGVGSTYKLMLMTGFCGGFSTFSTFTGETFGLIQSGNPSAALLNVGGSLLLCLFCLFVGIKAASWIYPS